MLPRIEKIIYSTKDKLYFKFIDGDIKVLDIKSFDKMPGWQLIIVKEQWQDAKIIDGYLHFKPMVDIGADTVKSKSENLAAEELFKIVNSKRIAQKRIIQTLASLL
ncbi:MAG: hypothetical protein ABFS35_21875 [Bacteroidota bacterium]